jgi:hypothetical protein
MLHWFYQQRIETMQDLDNTAPNYSKTVSKEISVDEMQMALFVAALQERRHGRINKLMDFTGNGNLNNDFSFED